MTEGFMDTMKSNQSARISCREVEEAVSRLKGKTDLSKLSFYLDQLNHPERNLRVIHVAGTNGKGSVCSYIDSVLRTAGYRTTLFTSPHLISLRERFVSDGVMISEDRVVEAYLTVKDVVDNGMSRGLQAPAFYEWVFLMAMVLFAGEDPDYCILETGLGGRLDATVLCRPVLCVITSISLDHMGILGETVAEIAAEKAGIIKEGVPVAALCEDPEAFRVIDQVAGEKNCPVFALNPKEITILKNCENYIDFSMYNSYYNFRNLRIRSCAGYQVTNACLAALAVRVLCPTLEESCIREGLYRMNWPGRMEEIGPGIYVDGAHNPGAVCRVLEDLNRSACPWSLLFAVCEDKDYQAMIRMLAAFPFTRITVTGMTTGRRLPYERIRRLFAQYVCEYRQETTGRTPPGRDGQTAVAGFATVPEAMCYAVKNKRENERLLCLGSLYLVGELKRAAQEMVEIEREEET